jgi:hypothetical protein
VRELTMARGIARAMEPVEKTVEKAMAIEEAFQETAEVAL